MNDSARTAEIVVKLANGRAHISNRAERRANDATRGHGSTKAQQRKKKKGKR